MRYDEDGGPGQLESRPEGDGEKEGVVVAGLAESGGDLADGEAGRSGGDVFGGVLEDVCDFQQANNLMREALTCYR